MSGEDDFRVDSVGADAARTRGADTCTCASYRPPLCPIHGDDAHLSPDGRRLRQLATDAQVRWNLWVTRESGCIECGATVEGKLARMRHVNWHRRAARWLID